MSKNKNMAFEYVPSAHSICANTLEELQKLADGYCKKYPVNWQESCISDDGTYYICVLKYRHYSSEEIEELSR